MDTFLNILAATILIATPILLGGLVSKGLWAGIKEVILFAWILILMIVPIMSIAWAMRRLFF